MVLNKSWGIEKSGYVSVGHMPVKVVSKNVD